MRHLPCLIVRSFCLIILLAFLCAKPVTTCGAEVKNVLILHSYHRGLGWTDNIAKGIDQVLHTSGYPIEKFTEYMDTKRISSKEYLDDLALLLKRKYIRRPLNVIIASDDHAFQFLCDHQKDISPDTPVVFCGVNYFKEEFIRARPNFTGVVESFSIKGTIDAALTINPGLKKIYAAVDRTVTGKSNLKLLNDIIPDYKNQIEFVLITDKDMTEIVQEVRQLPAESIVLMLGITSDKSGNTFSLERSADLITRASNRPVYSLWDFHLNHGIVGGMLTSGLSQGITAAKLALRIMQGERPQDIPVIRKSPNQYIFDHAVLQKFNIPDEKLPAGSKVINRPFSFYDRYKRIVLVILAIFTILSGLIAALSVSIIRRRKIETELRQHKNNLEKIVAERTSELTYANKALTDSEEKYRSLSDAAFEAIGISENGKIIEANKTLGEMFGYPPSELIGMPSENLAAPEDRENVKTKVRTGYEQSYESIGLKKDGSIFPAEVRARMFAYKGRQVRCSVIRDISYQKKAEEKMQTALTCLRKIFDTVNAMVYVADMETYELLFTNKYMKQLFGDIEGKKCWEAIHSGQTGPCNSCKLPGSFANNETIFPLIWEIHNSRNNEWYECRDEIVKWIDGRIVRVQVATNISRRKKHEEEREKLLAELKRTLAEVKTLRGIIPICAACKKIRDDQGYWNQIESYLAQHSEADFSHGICPDCAQKLYGKFNPYRKKE